MCVTSQRHSGSRQEQDWRANEDGTAFNTGGAERLSGGGVAALEAPSRGDRRGELSPRATTATSNDTDLATASAPSTHREQFKAGTDPRSSKTSDSHQPQSEQRPEEPILSRKQRRKIEAAERRDGHNGMQTRAGGNKPEQERNPLTAKREEVTRILAQACEIESTVIGKNQVKGFQRGVIKSLHELLFDRQLTEKNIKNDWHDVLLRIKEGIRQLFNSEEQPRLPAFLNAVRS